MSHPSGADGAHAAGPIGWIREIVLDCPDPWDLAGFWAGLLGGTPVQWYPGWVTLEPPPHGQRLSFQESGGAEGGSPAGRGATGPATHFDVLVSDLADAHERVVGAGAVFVSERVSPRPGPGGEQVPWRVYRDPAGHPFCLVVR
jgi:hypothetical protein